MIRNLVTGLVNLIYPRVCVVCKNKLTEAVSKDDFICGQCRSNIKYNLPPFCHSCGRHLEKRQNHKNVCPHCIKQPLYFDRAFSPCVYEGTLKELIHAFKYHGKDYLGATLSNLMVKFIEEYNLPLDLIDYIIPIPLHRARLREREFNQAEILSRHIAKRFNKVVLNDALERRRYTKTQTELEESMRLLNVKGSFSVTKKDAVRGKNILLVDDVLTSGATASEAASILKDAKANIVFTLTLAN